MGDPAGGDQVYAGGQYNDGIPDVSFSGTGAPVSLIGETMLWTAAALTLLTGRDYLRAGLRHAGAEDQTRRAEPAIRP